MSTQICGCDPDHKTGPHHCKRYPECDQGRWERSKLLALPAGLTSDFSKPLPSAAAEYDKQEALAALRPGLFPRSAQGRKDHPVFTGVLMYFPKALAAVAHVSKLGNDQHNPGQPLHWAREKSTDQMDAAIRHMMNHGVGEHKDSSGSWHLANAAWRILAELELTIEKEREGK